MNGASVNGRIHHPTRADRLGTHGPLRFCTELLPLASESG